MKIEVTTCEQGATGSGFFIDQVHVLTAAHVVADTTSVVIKVGGRSAAGWVIGFDTRADVALIEVTSGSVARPPLKLDDGDLEVGAPIAAIGFPEGGALTSTRGHVTATNESVQVQDGVTRSRLVKTGA